MTQVPRTLTIAGSDSGGGAGIQADLKTFLALGCHGMSAITALTAQNTTGVSAIYPVTPTFVTEQIEAVATDIGVDAAKTGMLASAAIVEAVADSIERLGISNLVVDPVFVSKSRDWLLEREAVATLIERIFPLARLITPNLFEAAGLLGRPEATTLDEMRSAALALKELGPEAVLVKGGHLPGAAATDVFFDGGEPIEISSERFETKDTHGTGCTLSAAITAYLARGSELEEAVNLGKRFISGAISSALRIGKGYGPVSPGWDLPAWRR